MKCPECGEKLMSVECRTTDNYRRRRFNCGNGHIHVSVEVLTGYNELKTILRDKNGSIAVGTDPLKIFRERAIRAIEAAL